MTVALEAARRAWLEQRPAHEAFATHVSDLLAREAKRRGMYCRVEARAKDVKSFLKKAILKKYSDPVSQMGDKVGARLAVPSLDLIPGCRSIVEHLFGIIGEEDKGVSLGSETFGYQGVHYEVRLRPEHLIDEHAALADLTFELQVATFAQRVWADLAHPLTYKPDQDPPPQVRRSLHRLAAVLEIVDDEFARAKAVISDLEGFEEYQLLGELERHFYRFAARTYNRELSLEILGGLKSILGTTNVAELSAPISSFLERNEAKVEELFVSYANDDRYPLLFQPEALLVFWRLECDPYTLKDAWQKFLPDELLDELGFIWGHTL
jgi:ppGpp synthetase/RelA/SpoT-type nucleotidyltranferase